MVGGGGKAEQGDKHGVERKPCKQRYLGRSTQELSEKWGLFQSY